jgi:hypothetical protein
VRLSRRTNLSLLTASPLRVAPSAVCVGLRARDQLAAIRLAERLVQPLRDVWRHDELPQRAGSTPARLPRGLRGRDLTPRRPAPDVRLDDGDGNARSIGNVESTDHDLTAAYGRRVMRHHASRVAGSLRPSNAREQGARHARTPEITTADVRGVSVRPDSGSAPIRASARTCRGT